MPATFIDKDLTLKFVTPENNTRDEGIKYWYQSDEKGNRILKYSMGMSVLYAPFFFVAHVLAGPLGYQPDGFSDIYEFFIEFSGLFYLLFGLIYLRKLLLKFYGEKIVAFTLVLIFFGTNVLYYATADAAMSHTYTFSLFSVFLYYVFSFYEKATVKNTLILALCFGLIILVRPVNILLILPFLFFGIDHVKDVSSCLNFVLGHYKYALLFIIITVLLVLPQLIYYKYVTGHYLVFSYGKEGFFFNRFHLWDVLFSFRKGWLIYTPIMLFAFCGFWYMRSQVSKVFSTGLFILFPVYMYVVSSWWCWWYGGSFSQRSFIDIYPLLALPLAAFLFKLQSFDNGRKIIIYIVVMFMLLLNIFQTFQYKYNIIDYDGMTAKEYVQVFGTLDEKKIDTTLLDKPNYERALQGLEE
ncbi:MAG: hypothetical protein V4677_14945 [Bacteroidota bacterium]